MQPFNMQKKKKRKKNPDTHRSRVRNVLQSDIESADSRSSRTEEKESTWHGFKPRWQ